jgi:DNA-directed RNA polymerase subunit H (RpoH/RPB5)
MLKTDPVAKYYGAKTDQVFKITRRSGVSGEVNYYRVVK